MNKFTVTTKEWLEATAHTSVVYEGFSLWAAIATVHHIAASNKSLCATMSIEGNRVQDLEDRLDIRLKNGSWERTVSTTRHLCIEAAGLTLVAALHGTDNATPCVHDTLPQRDDIVEDLVRVVWRRRDSGRLLQDLRNDGEVGLKVAADSARDVAKALEDGRLELVGQLRAPQVVQKVVHEVVAVRLAARAH